ncbi:MAG: DUF4258 domain-containing protein [Aeromonas jandaei]
MATKFRITRKELNQEQIKILEGLLRIRALSYSEHALERMISRGITFAQVMSAINHPRVMQVHCNDDADDVRLVVRNHRGGFKNRYSTEVVVSLTNMEIKTAYRAKVGQKIITKQYGKYEAVCGDFNVIMKILRKKYDI